MYKILGVMGTKSEQLQIRVTRDQKETLKRLAREAGRDVSAYVLARALPDARTRFNEAISALREGGQSTRFALAALNDLLSSLTGSQLSDVTSSMPVELRDLPPRLQNYVTAMLEQVSVLRGVPPPHWAHTIPPLNEPYFATSLRSLRLHLIRASPVAFKRRNLFVDATIGDRV